MLGFLPTRAYRPGTPGATTFLSPLSGTFNYGWDSFENQTNRHSLRRSRAVVVSDRSWGQVNTTCRSTVTAQACCCARSHIRLARAEEWRPLPVGGSRAESYEPSCTRSFALQQKSPAVPTASGVIVSDGHPRPDGERRSTGEGTLIATPCHRCRIGRDHWISQHSRR